MGKNQNERYTDEELIRRVWDIEDIKTLAYKRAVYIANEWRARELDELWVQEPEHQKTASLGRNTGWYVGLGEIRRYYVDKHLADRRALLEAISAQNPQIENRPENLNIGCSSCHTPTTGLVRLAGDGRTAKAMFYSLAQETQPNPDGTARALWVPEKQAFDFVKENGKWKIWHLVLATDITCEAGENFEDHGPYADYETDPVMLEFGTPTVPHICHDSTFNWWDDYPPVPKDYETFTDDISYGPEGYHAPEFFAWRGREGGPV